MTVAELLSHFHNHSLEIRIQNIAKSSEDDVFHSNVEALSNYYEEEVEHWYVEWDLFPETPVQILKIIVDEDDSDQPVFDVEDIRRVREELMSERSGVAPRTLDTDELRELNAEQHLQP